MISVIIAKTFVLNAQSFRAGVRVRMDEAIASALSAAGFVTLPESESAAELPAADEAKSAAELPAADEAKSDSKNKKR